MATKTSAKRQQELELEVEYLKTRLKETIDAFTAIRQGEVDAFMVPSPQGAQVYILEGIERRYRAIVETMYIAALILSTDGTILYCNSQFAQMLDLNLSQVMGGSLQNLISKADREHCAAFLRECLQWRSKVDLGLVGSAGKQIMAELSGSPLQLEDSTGVCLVVTDITERKRSGAALQQNERKLRLIIDNLRDTVFAYDMNRQLIFVNSTFEILTGYTIGELYARNFINYLHPDDATRMMSLWEDVFQGKAFAEEFRIVRKDGQIRWCASSWSPLLDEQGQQIGVQGRETDVTGRKRAEEALQESEEKYRTLVDNIPGSEFRCEATPPRRVILQSTEIENISGYPASDFLDGSILFDDIELPEDVEKINQAIESAIADKKSYIIEYRLRHADGSIHWVSERGHVTYSEQGEPLWLDGISFDITEQKQIEKALQESEERFRSFSEAAFEGITLHERGVLLSANDQFFEMFGYKPDELLGKQTISLVVAPTARKYMRSQIARGGRGLYESIGLRKDGTKFPMEIRAQDMEYKGRKARVVVLRDITAQVQA
ncbi:MAG: PAS domain S-box protein, partial [Anaerolineales bacterium]|nr:PAS domain S-box protein [Anaerolineales bacterium]